MTLSLPLSQNEQLICNIKVKHTKATPLLLGDLGLNRQVDNGCLNGGGVHIESLPNNMNSVSILVFEESLHSWPQW